MRLAALFAGAALGYFTGLCTPKIWKLYQEGR